MADINSDNNSSISSDGDSESVADNMTMSTVAKIDSKDAIVTINGVTVFNPRETYSVELHLSLLHFVGQTNDIFTIHYGSIVDLYSLPESYDPQARTFVVITLVSPTCRGETSYPHIVMQFETGCQIKSPPYTSIELLKYKFRDGLESPYSRLIHGFFTKTLSALSSIEVTRPGEFPRFEDGGYAVKCKSKADGILYPLAEGLFFLPEPPTLIHYTEISFLELKKKVRGSDKLYFDLRVRLLKTEQHHLFWEIDMSKYYTLKEYFSDIKLKLKTQSDDDCSPSDTSDDSSDTDGEQEMHVKREKRSKNSAKDGDEDEDEDESQKTKRIKKEPNSPKAIMTAFLFFSEAERENVRKENPSITFTDIGKIMGEKWRNMSAAEREPYEAKAQADRKRYLDEIVEYNYHPEPDNQQLLFCVTVQDLKTRDDEDEVGSSADSFKEDSDSDDVTDSIADESEVNLGKRMKDPNTPSSQLVALLCFSRAEQENTKKENPSASFSDMWEIHEDKWRNMSAAEKEPYVAMAKADRQHYARRK